MGRFLYKSGVKFTSIEKSGRNRWSVIFASGGDANEALTNPYIKESEFSISVPRFLLYRIAIIKGVPVDCDIEEVTKELKDSNPNVNFENIERLKRRIYSNNNKLL